MSNKPKIETYIRSVRMPIKLHDDIQEIADREERSWNYVLIKLVKKAIQIYPKT